MDIGGLLVIVLLLVYAGSRYSYSSDGRCFKSPQKMLQLWQKSKLPNKHPYASSIGSFSMIISDVLKIMHVMIVKFFVKKDKTVTDPLMIMARWNIWLSLKIQLYSLHFLC